MFYCFKILGETAATYGNWAVVMLILFFHQNCFGQGLEVASGAKAMGLGGAAITIEDEYAWGNNPAGAADLKNSSITSSFKNRFSLSSMNSMMLQGSVPIKKITAGITAEKYGDSYYSEQKLGIGIASKIGNVALGTQVHVLQVRMDELPTQWAWIGEFGGIVQLSKTIKWAAHVWNFNLAEIKTRQKMELPVVLRTGLSYQPNAKVTLNAQLNKHISYAPWFSAGLEYQIVEWLAFRTGLASRPFNGNIGAGLKFGKFKLDYAFSAHAWIGNSHQLSLAIIFPKKVVTQP